MGPEQDIGMALAASGILFPTMALLLDVPFDPRMVVEAEVELETHFQTLLLLSGHEMDH